MEEISKNRLAVSIFSGGLTVSWLIVWASFTTAPLTGGRFSLLTALVTFTTAAVVISGAKMRGWRNYAFVCLHVFGLVGFVLYTLHQSFFSATRFLSTTWLSALADQAHDIHGFMTMLLVAGWSAAFWISGAQLGRRKQNFSLICSRFDAGLTGLFALLLVQLVLVVRGGLTMAAPPDAFYMFTFFLCGLLAIGLVRYRGLAKKQFLPGRRGIVILVAFAVTILAVTGILTVVAPPILTPVAEEGYDVLKTVAKPVEGILVRVVRFLFGRDVDYSLGSEVPPPAAPGDLLPDQTNTWGVTLARMMAQGFVGLLFLVLMVFSGYMIWRFIQWLFYRDSRPQGQWRPLNIMTDLFYRLVALLRYCRRSLKLFLGKPHDIGQIYTALKAWAGVSGIIHKSWETPLEFADRLSLHFPQTANEINTIVGMFQNQVYGEMTPDTNAITTAHAAWRRLRSPLHWSSRWRSLFERPRGL